jgi:FixJ family two-component response regulator
MDGRASTVFFIQETGEYQGSAERMLDHAGYTVRSFGSTEQFLNNHPVETPGCVLLDGCAPTLHALQSHRAMDQAPCTCPIIFLTDTTDIETSVNAMKEGAFDLLTKPIDATDLCESIERAFAHDAEQRRQRAITEIFLQRLASLTLREREIMSHVVRGRMNKQIAADLCAGEKTIKVHRARVMQKMRVRSVAELVQIGVRVEIFIEPILDIGSRAIRWRPITGSGNTIIRGLPG